MHRLLSKKAATLDERLRHPNIGTFIPDESRAAAGELYRLMAQIIKNYKRKI